MEAKQALEDLQTIRQVMERTRNAIATSGAGYIMIVWGVIWLIGFTGSQFLHDELQGKIWLIAVPLGIVASIVLGHRSGKQVRGRPEWKIGAFWLALFFYASLWGQLFPTPDNAMVGSLFIVTVVMFGYVIMGLWLSTPFAWIGIGITALALIGYYLLPAYFPLWMALCGGGTLIGSGIYILRRWR